MAENLVWRFTPVRPLTMLALAAAIALLAAVQGCAASRTDGTSAASQPAGLEGTSWQFVRFEGSDDSVLTPDDPAKYTIAFDADGAVSVRVDCNRGRGKWTSKGPNQIEFGPLALTRAMCPPGSLHDHFVRQWDKIRSYVIRDGHLFLSLMADGGIFEFEPMDKAAR